MSWSRHLLAVGAGFLGVTACSAAGPSLGAPRATSVQASGKLAQFAWLAGCWERRTASRTIVEMWMPPDGGLMLGASRTVSNGAAREFEHLRIQQRGDTVTYTALPSGQRETSFRATRVSPSGFTVENPAHDFPQRITYTRRGSDSLIARVEGPGEGGTRGFTLGMGRVACTTGEGR